MQKCIKRDLFSKKNTSLGYKIHRFFFDLYWKYWGKKKRQTRIMSYQTKKLTNEIYEKAIEIRRLKEEKEDETTLLMYNTLNNYFKDKDF